MTRTAKIGFVGNSVNCKPCFNMEPLQVPWALGPHGFQLVGCVEPHSRSGWLDHTDEYGSQYLPSVNELLSQHDDLDFVVCSDADWCMQAALIVLRMKIPLVLEQGMLCNKKVANKLWEASLKSNTPVAVYYHYPCFFGISLAQAIIESGQLGKVQKLAITYAHNSNRYPYIKIEHAGIGMMSIQCAQLFRLLTGEEISSVTCVNILSRKGPVDQRRDEGTIHVWGNAGATGVFTSMASTQWGEGIDSGSLKVSVFSEGGAITWDEDQPEFLAVHPSGGCSRRYVKDHDYQNDSLIGELVSKLSISPPTVYHPACAAMATLLWRMTGIVDQWKNQDKLWGLDDYRTGMRQVPSLLDHLANIELAGACVYSAEDGGEKSSLSPFPDTTNLEDEGK